MTYRDDVVALRARIDRLQDQLDELDPVRLDRIEQQQQALAQQRVSTPSWLKWAVGLAGLAMLAGGFHLHEIVDEAERDADIAVSQATNAANLASQLRAATIPAVTAPDFDAVVRLGHVSSTNGEAPVAKGTACTVTVVPAIAGQGLNCQVRVQCGDHRIYGESGVGFVTCGIDDRRPNRARDDDPTPRAKPGGEPVVAGDPRLVLDLPKGTVVVSDAAPDFSVTIGLEPEGAPTEQTAHEL